MLDEAKAKAHIETKMKALGYDLDKKGSMAGTIAEIVAHLIPYLVINTEVLVDNKKGTIK